MGLPTHFLLLACVLASGLTSGCATLATPTVKPRIATALPLAAKNPALAQNNTAGVISQNGGAAGAGPTSSVISQNGSNGVARPEADAAPAAPPIAPDGNGPDDGAPNAGALVKGSDDTQPATPKPNTAPQPDPAATTPAVVAPVSPPTSKPL